MEMIWASTLLPVLVQWTSNFVQDASSMLFDQWPKSAVVVTISVTQPGREEEVSLAPPVFIQYTANAVQVLSSGFHIRP
jgi:hypothetical protein